MKYAFITGGAGGLGGQACDLLADNGWTVFAADINQEALNKITHKNVIPIQVDITDITSIERARDEILKTTDKLDAVINFAGMMKFTSLIENHPKTMDIAMKVNLFGMIYVNYVMYPLVEKACGRIINTSSEMAVVKAQPFVGPYSVTKRAVDFYTEALRRECNITNKVKVIKLQPGSFKTNMHHLAAADFDRLIAGTERYKGPLASMKKLMTHELEHACDPKYMADAILKACTAKNPKIKYKIKNSKKLMLLNIFSDKIVDKIYLSFIK